MIHETYYLDHSVTITKLIRVRWLNCVAWIGGTRHEHKISVEKLEGDLDIDEKILKGILQNKVVALWTESRRLSIHYRNLLLWKQWRNWTSLKIRRYFRKLESLVQPHLSQSQCTPRQQCIRTKMIFYHNHLLCKGIGQGTLYTHSDAELLVMSLWKQSRNNHCACIWHWRR